MLMSILIVELLIYTWSRVQCIKTGYEIGNLSRIRKERLAEQNELKIELATLKAPERIAAIARNKLGLITPDPEKMVILP